MTAPAAKRAPRPRAPKAAATEPPAPQWPAVGADMETLRAMPDVVYLFTDPIPSGHYMPVITGEMDKAIHEGSATVRALPKEHRLMVDGWEAQAREAVFGPLKEWLGAIGAPPWEAPALEPLPVRRRPSRARRALVEDNSEAPTNTTGEAAGSAPASPVEQPEPGGAA